jgi:hypothetical protein
MGNKITVAAIRALGFEWPKTNIIQEYCVIENANVDIDKTLEKLRNSHTFYRNQITAAYNFKIRTGADYSDFTDKFEDYVRMEKLLLESIKHLEKILTASQKDASQ